MPKRIRLKVNLPIGKEHGATKGREFDVIDIEPGRRIKVSFIGDNKEVCCAFSEEFDYV